MMIMTTSNYSQFFNDDPWQDLNTSCYPEGRRLYLNDSRFWVSIDDAGRIMFFVHEEGKSNLKTLENLASINLKIDHSFADATRFCCTLAVSDDDLKHKFSIVAKDIAHSCSKFSGNELLSKVQLRIKSWANFLKPTRTGLSDSEYVGFWGELYVVSRYLMKLHSPKDALRFWVGPLGKKQDITLNTCAIEVKTSMSGDSRSITISSIEQLEKVTSSLFLLHLVGSPSSDSKGLSLKDLYESCIETFQDDMETETLFLNKISQSYGKANNEQLNNRILIITETLFAITDDFPSLTRANIPKAVTKVKYDVLLSDIGEFESSKSIAEVIRHG
jgi:hypothetical protein